MPQFTSNEKILAAVQELVAAWCDRRCLGALRHVLAAYPLASGLTDEWGALHDAIRNVRTLSRKELTEPELDVVDELIRAVGRIAHR